MPFFPLQELTVLKIKPDVEEACSEERFSAEQQGGALVESDVKEEPGEIEGCVRLLLCAVDICVFLSLDGCARLLLCAVYICVSLLKAV